MILPKSYKTAKEKKAIQINILFLYYTFCTFVASRIYNHKYGRAINNLITIN
jgi:hypothetical protein